MFFWLLEASLVVKNIPSPDSKQKTYNNTVPEIKRHLFWKGVFKYTSMETSVEIITHEIIDVYWNKEQSTISSNAKKKKCETPKPEVKSLTKFIFSVKCYFIFSLHEYDTVAVQCIAVVRHDLQPYDAHAHNLRLTPSWCQTRPSPSRGFWRPWTISGARWWPLTSGAWATVWLDFPAGNPDVTSCKLYRHWGR